MTTLLSRAVIFSVSKLCKKIVKLYYGLASWTLSKVDKSLFKTTSTLKASGPIIGWIGFLPAWILRKNQGEPVTE